MRDIVYISNSTGTLFDSDEITPIIHCIVHEVYPLCGTLYISIFFFQTLDRREFFLPDKHNVNDVKSIAAP